MCIVALRSDPLCSQSMCDNGSCCNVLCSDMPFISGFFEAVDWVRDLKQLCIWTLKHLDPFNKYLLSLLSSIFIIYKAFQHFLLSKILVWKTKHCNKGADHSCYWDLILVSNTKDLWGRNHVTPFTPSFGTPSFSMHLPKCMALPNIFFYNSY